MNFFKNRQIRKSAIHVLRQAYHLRCMREDLMKQADLKMLSDAEAEVRTALDARNWSAVEKSGDKLYACLTKLSPTYSHQGLRENIEIIVVAVAVAMAFRSYLVQPFKIPTGSMEPTLYGIHSFAISEPTIMDRIPLKLVKWFVTGDWYTEIKAMNSGRFNPGFYADPDDPTVVCFYIGDVRHRVPRDAYARLRFRPGEYVNKGDILYSAVVSAGDHVFVDKISWNFRRPRRGDVIVFSTDNINIPGVTESTHYIKRLVGLPGETISIDPPYLVADGRPVMTPASIARVVNRHVPGYPSGYQLVESIGMDSGILKTTNDVIKLGDRQYLAFGDNTGNSKDGRYWGAVPQSNLVGSAVMVYWPFWKRFGRID